MKATTEKVSHQDLHVLVNGERVNEETRGVVLVALFLAGVGLDVKLADGAGSIVDPASAVDWSGVGARISTLTGWNLESPVELPRLWVQHLYEHHKLPKTWLENLPDEIESDYVR